MISTSLNPFGDFEQASRAVLECLQKNVDMALWMVTRVDGMDWIVLDVEQGQRTYPVEPGNVLPWLDSFCVQMVAGHGPRCAPVAAEIPAYAAAPVGRRLTIASYIGVPLETSEGTLFGTLCAIDPTPKDDRLARQMPLIELAARLLATILDRERSAEDAKRRAQIAEVGANTDPLTGLPNRRAWDVAIGLEEARCRRYGDTASVLILDLDGLKRTNDGLGHAAGDALLKLTADTLRLPLRVTDFIARLGGDEFGILAPHTPLEAAEALKSRLSDALHEVQITASFGVAQRRHDRSLSVTAEEADLAMYAEKRRRPPTRSA